jgi:sulfate adenylyltransferase subunit 1 (EFTu-like GTPase family)
MIEIKNKTRSPVQLVVRSRKSPRSFTTLIVPGIGKGKNVRYLADELATDVIERVERMGLISTRYVPNTEVVDENTKQENL